MTTEIAKKGCKKKISNQFIQKEPPSQPTNPKNQVFSHFQQEKELHQTVFALDI